MNYFVSRGNQQYGPYSLADVQRYVQQGNIALTDLARSDGMTDWVPVSQIIGNISVPQPGNPAYGAPANPYGSPANPYGAPVNPGSYGAPVAPYAPQQLPIGTIDPPPSLHWALVLLFSVFSCCIFGWVWIVVEAVWVRKIRPDNNGLFFYIAAIVANYGGYFAIRFLTMTHSMLPLATVGLQWALLALIWGLYAFGSFHIKAALEDYYNREEPIGLRLSSAMTFFFAIFYFQYHFNQIHEMKQMAAMRQRPGGFPGQYNG